MKNITKLMMGAGLTVAAMGFGSCTGDLDLLPTDPSQTTAATFEDEPEKYLDEVFSDVFLNFYTFGPDGQQIVHSFDGGMGTFQRAIFNMEEIPADETTWLAEQDVNFGQLMYGVVDANNTAATAGYSRLMTNVAICQDFINTCNKGFFDGSEAAKAKIPGYVRQVKALRGACYFYLLSCYGNVPYVNENTEIGSIPVQMKRADLFKLVVKDMEDLVAEWPENETVNYGYVGKDMAQSILVKLYLNAEVFSGEPAWDKCLEHATAIINRHKGTGFQGSGLCMNYHQLFGQGNQQYTPGGSSNVNEILWSLPGCNGKTESWGNATLMLDGWLGEVEGFGCKLADYNSDDGWKCLAARKEFVQKFQWNDAEMSKSDDQRVRFWCTSAQKFNFDKDDELYIQANFGSNGYLAVKFTNWVIKDDGTIDVAASGPSLKNQFTIDYPMIRLAEIYLSAAEAILHGAGNAADALTYVNYIRERAGLDAWTASQLSLTSLEDERCRELYTEGTRRTDLIRYGKWISGYTWTWKGNTPEGTDFDRNFNLYPLPNAVCNQAGYTQNPGY